MCFNEKKQEYYKEASIIWSNCKKEIKNFTGEGELIWCKKLGRYLNHLLTNESICYCKVTPKIKLYRTQRGNLINEGIERMLPINETAVDGRCNVGGIAYTYTSQDRDTSILEIKPNNGEIVTVAEIELKRTHKFLGIELYKIIMEQCRGFERIFGPVTSNLIEIISKEYSTKITKEEDYKPLQVITSVFKELRSDNDGVFFLSSMTEKYNFVLYKNGNSSDIYKDIEIVNRTVYCVEKIEGNHIKVKEIIKKT